MSQEEKEKKKKVLFCGLGGGLDVVNASLLFSLSQEQPNIIPFLGSIRTCDVKNIKNSVKFDNNVCCFGNQKIKKKWRQEKKEHMHLFEERDEEEKTIFPPGRYAEPFVSSFLSIPIIYFSSRKEEDEEGEEGGERERRKEGLRRGIEQAKEIFDLDLIIFCDGGGDSLVLQSSDTGETSETSDPFDGGDALLLAAVQGLDYCYQALVSVGLDINIDSFFKNLELLETNNGYFGKINPVTAETITPLSPSPTSLSLSSLFPLESPQKIQEGLKNYLSLASSLLVLCEDHLSLSSLSPSPSPPPRFLSHTASITYHAMSNNFGKRRTFVPWEPYITKEEGGKEKGVIVVPDFQWIYFVSCTIVENLKQKLNKKE